MLREKLVTFLKVRPDEVRMASLVAALFLCIQAGQGIGENAAFALFLARLDVALLPYMYMALGGFVFLASIGYAASLGRFENARVVASLMAGSVFLFLAEWAAIVFLNLPLYPLLWLSTYGLSVIIGTLLWTVAGEVCDARQAKRLFPLFTSMGILGSVLGNSLTGVSAKLAGTDNLVLLYAVSLGLGLFLSREITKSHFKSHPASKVKYNLMNDLRTGYNFVLGSQLFRLVAFLSVLYSVLFFAVDFPFSAIVSNEFKGNEAGLAGFKGLFTSITTAATFLVSLLLANRLYTRLGIVNSILIMPLTYIVGFAVFFVSYTFGGAVLARFAQLVVLGGLMGTAWNALFNVVPPERRGQVLAFNTGVPAQVGVVLSGVMIILSRQVLSTQAVLLLGVVVALACVYLSIRMKSAYGEALLSALRAGRVEVFSNEEEAFAGYQDDPAALLVVLKALHDPKPFTRRLAAEMLAKLGSKLAIPDLIERLADPEASVRAAAIRALADLGAGAARGQVIRGLDDRDDLVREETLASLPRLGADSSPELVRTLDRLSKDANVRVRAHAAVVLAFLGEGRRARTLLSKLLKDRDVDTRQVALDAFGHMASLGMVRSSFDPGIIRGALYDPSPVVRREAIRVASLLKDESMHTLVMERLPDEDAGVRRIASETLKRAWPRSRTGLIRIIEEGSDHALDSALDAIPPGDPEILPALRGFIQREVLNIRHVRRRTASLPPEGPAISLLIETLKHRESLSEERLIKAVGLFGNPRALDLIRKTLNAGDSGTRAEALEALETLGDKNMTQEVLPILDRGGIVESAKDPKMEAAEVLGTLLSDRDHWLRAIAARSAAELRLKEFVPALRGLQKDRVPLVRQAAADALARMNGEAKMKTLKTLSTLDRILLLREVPMFSKLSPEDLEQIAEIAQEQLFPDQALICREDEPGNTMFIIVSGKVKVTKKAGKKENVIATRGAGEFVGEMAILESAPRSATLRASGDVRLLTIEGDAFERILLDRPEVAVSVLRHMSTRVRDLTGMVGAPVTGS